MNDIPSKKRIKKKVTNLEELNEELHCVDWETLLLGRSVEDMWKEFSSILKFLTEKHTKTFIEYPSKPWINNEVPRMIRQKKTLWQRYTRSKRIQDYQNHRNLSNVLSSIESKEVLQI
ncbi:hypothetical protein HHI36_004520 [Cryptolaemus montrouzieri]|uniref:Uncharacterized protein n=1 Tax=Cryptolaemus montrouzieri TaxID=559131 RepID=A0ABD2NRQ9_9CUCU